SAAAGAIAARARIGGSGTTARPAVWSAARETSGARGKTAVDRRPDGDAPYSQSVSDDRERDLRRLERDRRRREQGKQTYFEGREALDRWPLLTEISEQPTMVLRVPPPRGETAPAAEEPQRQRLAVSTAIFAAATGLSRVPASSERWSRRITSVR